VGIHFTAPTTRCSIERWKSNSGRVLVSTILAHFRNLTNGLPPRLPVEIIWYDFDGPMGFDARTVMREANRGLRHEAAYARRSCRGEISITAGTVFAGTRKALRAWFLAMWFVTSQKPGASALGLQRVLGLGSYQTAWTWLHKMRRAMVLTGRSRLRRLLSGRRNKMSMAVRPRIRPSW
jgi:hypothetical protein